MQGEFEAVIGLEVHAQLSTESKIFCGCPARLPEGKSVADLPPNANACPVCAGHPGTLPVLNRKVVEYAVRAGLATHCAIQQRSVFARKNYFYPDLPKGYQISQYDRPICENGWLEIMVPEATESKRVRIRRIHMEEDAGKNIHLPGCSLVNLNRAGIPLIEIVSEPDLSTPIEAGTYLRILHSIVTSLGICDGNMEEGNFRCDANVSIRQRGAKELGTRVEIKNVNSFRFIEKAIEHEILRQINVVRSGARVIQETRTYDSGRNVTISMRTKEEAEDYRYFPDPDLLEVRLEEKWIEAIRISLPELPEQKKARFMADFGLPAQDAAALADAGALSRLFEKVVQAWSMGEARSKGLAKLAANWILGEVARLANEEGVEVDRGKLESSHIVEIVQLTQEQVLSSTGAKQVMSVAWKTGEPVSTIVEREGLKQVSDTGVLDSMVEKIIAAFPKQAAEFRAGKEKVLGFLVGQAMKETGGKANPALLQELLRKKLS